MASRPRRARRARRPIGHRGRAPAQDERRTARGGRATGVRPRRRSVMRDAIARVRPAHRRAPKPSITTHEALGSLRAHAVHRAHEVLDIVPGLLRRLSLFLLVGTITMAAFAAGMLVVLWHAVR